MNGQLLLEGPDGYGPAPEPGPHLREAWDAAGGRALLAVQHQHLVMCLLTAEQATGQAWRQWCARGADGDLVLPLAAGGRHTLTAPMLEWYLTTADAWRDDAPFDWYECALDSVADLSGVVLEAWDEDVDPVAWAAEVRTAVAAAGSAYVVDGRPLSPDGLLERALRATARDVANERPRGNPFLDELRTWTGPLPPSPVDPTSTTAAHLAAVERYAEQVAALPWRPGTKYFYGHDVDGGRGSARSRRPDPGRVTSGRRGSAAWVRRTVGAPA